jgi:hypothetical protein
MLRPATVRLGVFGVFSALVAAQVDVDTGFLASETTVKPGGCTAEIETCRAAFIDASAGKSGEKQCTAFHTYQKCYYSNVGKCTFVEKQLQDKHFIQERTNIFKIWPKCTVSTTPWDSSLLSDSQLSQSFFGYQGSSPNTILSDSGSGISGTEPSGPISGTLGLYMNVGQWIVFSSCCCCCCAGLAVLAICQGRRKRGYYGEYYDDEFDEGFYPPPHGMFPPMQMAGFSGYGGSFQGGMPTYPGVPPL